MGILCGGVGVAFLNFIIWLIKYRASVPEHLKDRVEDQTDYIEELRSRLDQKTGECQALKDQLASLQDSYVESVRVLAQMQRESDILKKQIEDLQRKLSEFKTKLTQIGITDKLDD